MSIARKRKARPIAEPLEGRSLLTATPAPILVPASPTLDFPPPQPRAVATPAETLGWVTNSPIVGAGFASFTPTLPGAYQAAIDWGDGSSPVLGAVVPSPGGAVAGVNPYVAEGSHTYTKPGDYTVTIDLVDYEGQNSYTTTSVVVSPTVTIDNTEPVFGTQGAFTSTTLGSGEYSFVNLPSTTPVAATVDFGDGTAPVFAQIEPYVGVTAPLGLFIPGAPPHYVAFDFAAAHAYAADGTYTVTIDLIGPDGSSKYAQTTATIFTPAVARLGSA